MHVERNVLLYFFVISACKLCYVLLFKSLCVCNCIKYFCCFLQVFMLTRRSPVPRSPTPPLMSTSPQTPQLVGVPYRFVTPYATPSQPKYIGSACVTLCFQKVLHVLFNALKKCCMCYLML